MHALNQFFRLASAVSLFGWLLLVSFPFWPPAAREALLTTILSALCILYVYLLGFGKRYDEAGKTPRGGFSTLRGVIMLFSAPRVVLAGWIHFLVFDLFVGAYVVTDAARVGIAHWYLMPILALTLMFGPAGLLVYIVTRLIVS